MLCSGTTLNPGQASEVVLLSGFDEVSRNSPTAAFFRWNHRLGEFAALVHSVVFDHDVSSGRRIWKLLRIRCAPYPPLLESTDLIATLLDPSFPLFLRDPGFENLCCLLPALSVLAGIDQRQPASGCLL